MRAGQPTRTLTRRALLRAVAGSALTACAGATAPPAASTAGAATSAPPSSPFPTATRAARRTLVYADAMADGGSSSGIRNIAVLIEDGRIRYAGPRDGAPDAAGAER